MLDLPLDEDSPEQERLRTLAELRENAENEVESLQALLEQTRRGRIKLQLEVVS